MIFVNIVSYRDKQLIDTVKSCISKAKFPHMLKIGVFWQYDEEEDLSALDGISNLHIHKVYWKNVKGSVCWARYMNQQLFFDNEKYYFQVDSHTLFNQDWDEMLIEMFESLPNSKSVISVGPPYYFDTNAEGGLTPHKTNLTTVDGFECEDLPPQQKLDDLSRSGYFMYGFCKPTNLTSPFLGRHISAALLFSKGTWVSDVPYDPNLYFQGEEGSLALRSFTRGYDIYVPNKLIIWHLHYHFHERKRHWNTFEKEEVSQFERMSYSRYQDILQGKLKGVYGLGEKRTYKDWIEFSGVDLVKGEATEEAFKGVIPVLK
jgi:hypothetical protein